MSELIIQQGGIYKLPFPYTDLAQQKFRPALAITPPDSTGDARFVFITTTPPVPPAKRLALGSDDFAGPSLPFQSFVRPEKSMLLNGSLAVKQLAQLTPQALQTVLRHVIQDEVSHFSASAYAPRSFVPGETVNYREAYGMFACNGILFNHESPRRGETFVTRKITRGLANIAQGLENCLYMGNLDALRDWGHAIDYVRMQWLMLQQPQPEDFVIATGVQYSVRQFIEWSASELGITLDFKGQGLREVAEVLAVSGDKAPAVKVGDVLVRVDPRYFRPAEVDTLLGDPTKAKEKLGWVPEITAQEMCAEMVAADLKAAQRHALLKAHGHEVVVSIEN